MDHKCEIETYYYPEKSSTSVDQHIPVSVIRCVTKLGRVVRKPVNVDPGLNFN